MEELKVVISDDDVSSRTLLSYFIELLSEYKIVGQASTGKELIEVVMKEKPNIVLVDIQMPLLNGVEAAKSCKEMLPSLQVIFTTGCEEFAVEAFNISATDYIVKPIEKVRLFIALEKAKQALQLQGLTKANPVIKNKLAIKSNHTFVYILIEDILYIEKEGRKLIVHTDKDRYESVESLQEMEDRLPKYFFKTHRSYLVNLRKIVKIKPFGETYIAEFNVPDKKANISKLKIQVVHRLLGL
ncbi:LytTR family DNA-binding domain-containing protein [Neobacillus sp. DY30]|uniref:LytR/AlgR family response regulator transcription factor n=1 Tax=Neobacillus sp. DY30 TaxID=3047871 RepID=UPI0024C01812|nr:LytTR family DNA-binding domain-containing protein [Neobacillus sp. DY30]WHY00428.1 LytTR family DNA-binding domain-containing protein [Neobacillus sp. DY30]